jgi:hypothetical protein
MILFITLLISSSEKRCGRPLSRQARAPFGWFKPHSADDRKKGAGEVMRHFA